MTRMRYKDFTFPHNPRKIQVDGGQRLAEHRCLDGRTVLEALGRQRRQVDAQGELTGSQAWRQLEQLVFLAGEETPGLLALPGMDPFPAYCTGIDFLGEGDGQVLGYRIRFQEAGEEGRTIG